MDKIMVVDDEKRIVEMISEFMKVNQIEVIPAYNGVMALQRLNQDIQLLILDINMEKLNGIDLCKIIRQKYNIPIIFLSSKTTQSDKVLGLGIGADDYITKPFDPLELVARVKSHIRRYQEYCQSLKRPASRVIRFNDITVYREAYKVTKDKQEISLSTTEFKLLLFFIDNAFKALTRNQILQHVWESEQYDENTVTTYVKRLRDKLPNDKNEEPYFKSVRGVGYIFEAVVAETSASCDSRQDLFL